MESDLHSARLPHERDENSYQEVEQQHAQQRHQYDDSSHASAEFNNNNNHTSATFNYRQQIQETLVQRNHSTAEFFDRKFETLNRAASMQ